MKNVGKKIVTVVLGIGLLVMLSYLSGCQTSVHADSRFFYKGENGNNEFKSRATNPNGYHSWSLGKFGKDD